MKWCRHLSLNLLTSVAGNYHQDKKKNGRVFSVFLFTFLNINMVKNKQTKKQFLNTNSIVKKNSTAFVAFILS